MQTPSILPREEGEKYLRFCPLCAKEDRETYGEAYWHSLYDFRMMSDEEASKYKFDFCKNCPFYECELVEEYTQFRENHAHAQLPQPQISVTVVDADSFDFTQNDGRIIQPKAIIPMSDEKDNENAINLTYLHSVDVDTDSSDTEMLSYDWTKQKGDCFMNCRHVYQ